LDYYHQGKRVRESSGTTDKTEARNILQSKIGQRAEGRLVIGADGVTFADLMEMVVTDYKVNGKKSLINVRVKIRKHLAPFFGSMRANKITTADVERGSSLTAGSKERAMRKSTERRRFCGMEERLPRGRTFRQDGVRFQADGGPEPGPCWCP